MQLRSLKPAEPAIGTGSRPAGETIETAHFVLALDPKTGAITRLRNKTTGVEWAGDNNPIALVAYQTLLRRITTRLSRAT